MLRSNKQLYFYISCMVAGKKSDRKPVLPPERTHGPRAQVFLSKYQYSTARHSENLMKTSPAIFARHIMPVKFETKYRIHRPLATVICTSLPTGKLLALFLSLAATNNKRNKTQQCRKINNDAFD